MNQATVKSFIQNLLLILALCAGTYQAVAQNFVISSSPGVGSFPQSVVAADVNGDGKLDLISANEVSSSLSVGRDPESVVAADINGDGKLDLINANAIDNTLTVLTNNGRGGFALAATLSVGNGPYCVCAADVNGDGKLDLISANEGSNSLTVLTNNGSGGFALAATLSVGINPDSVVAADVNGDGRLDLISANSSTNTLTVLTNNILFPPPSFTPPVAVKTSGNGLLVSWPSASAGWSLQQSPGLTTSQWGPAGYSGYTITDDGTNKSLFIASQPGNMFFRMMHP